MKFLPPKTGLTAPVVKYPVTSWRAGISATGFRVLSTAKSNPGFLTSTRLRRPISCDFGINSASTPISDVIVLIPGSLSYSNPCDKLSILEIPPKALVDLVVYSILSTSDLTYESFSGLSGRLIRNYSYNIPN